MGCCELRGSSRAEVDDGDGEDEIRWTGAQEEGKDDDDAIIFETRKSTRLFLQTKERRSPGRQTQISAARRHQR
jgi:hypothetical protein